MGSAMASESESAARTTLRVNRKISWRILWFLCVLYFVSYLDRIGLSYAGPNGMNKELGLSSTAFGFAAGIFFVGYILVEVPSNMALHRFGPRKWLARIIISWGVIQTLSAVAPNATVLYVLRFLLGVAEGGFAPGVIFYLARWFSDDYRGRAVSRFLFSAVFATAAGAPLSLLLIDVGNASSPLGMNGWRFLFFATGLPAVILGIVTWFYLVDGPQHASWLSTHEKATVQANLAADEAAHPIGAANVRSVLRSGRVWLLGFCYFSFLYGAYALTFFLPSILAGFQDQFDVHYSTLQIALLTTIPFACGGAAQLWFGQNADRKGRLGAHIAVSAVLGLIGGVAASVASGPLVMMACLCLMAIGVTAGAPLILVLGTRINKGIVGAATIAIVNTIGVSSGFFGPYITGWLRDLTGDQNAGIILISVMLAACVLIGVRLDRNAPVPVLREVASETLKRK